MSSLQRRWWLVLSIAALAACSRGQRSSSDPEPVAQDPWAEWRTQARAGLLADGWTKVLVEGNLADRRLATALLASSGVQVAVAQEWLARLLHDPDPKVRILASHGLRAVATAPVPPRGRDDPADPVGVSAAKVSAVKVSATLTGRAVVERRPAVRAALLEDLGGIGIDSVPVIAGLEAGDPVVQAGACRGITAAAKPIPDTAVRVLAVVAANPGSSRQACVAALAALPTVEAAELRKAVVDGLVAAARDEDPAVRICAVRALAKYEEEPARDALLGRVMDPEWQVAAEGFRSLGKLSDRTGRHLLAALRRRMERIGPDTPPVGSESRVLGAAFSALAVSRATSRIYDVAVDAYEKIGDLSTMWKSYEDIARVHCAAAQWVDVARGWPSRIRECGEGVVEDVERDLMAIRVFGLLEGEELARSVQVAKIHARTHSSRVRAAALRAMGGYGEHADPSVLRSGLASGVASEVSAACEAYAQLEADPAPGPCASLPSKASVSTWGSSKR